MGQDRIEREGQKDKAGPAAQSAGPPFQPLQVVLDTLVAAERRLNPALTKFLQLHDRIEGLSVEEILLLRPEIAEAIEAGEAEAKLVRAALERLQQAQPEPARRVPEGF